MFCCDSIITSEQKNSQPLYNNQVFLYVSEAHVLIVLVLVLVGLGLELVLVLVLVLGLRSGLRLG